MDTSADSQVRFALLALQNGLINDQQWVNSCQEWVADKSRSMEQVLLSNGSLQAEQCELLNQLLRFQADRPSNNTDLSLDTLASFEVPAIREQLRQIEDDDLSNSLARWNIASGQARDSGSERSRSAEGPLPAVTPDAAAEPTTFLLGQSTSQGARFRVLRPLDSGRGGMGFINVAEDAELGREVALKQIRPERADEPAYRDKFRLEAEITGNLEHPSIVPIYGLGADASGRPFYAMRWVRGENLGQAINEFHRKHAAGEVSFDSVEFRGLIDRLIDVCQAVSYAHSRGILHRDLKPGNVMVGKYGETLVIDWGLARSPNHDAAHNATGASLEPTPDTTDATLEQLHVRSGSRVEPTLQGSVMGTLGYAPPEQVQGQVDAIGPASDVYGLGAILYQLLCGHTTVATRDRSLQDIVADIVGGRIQPPNQRVRGIPKSLTAICLKSLATDPTQRYSTSEEFIAELERWKADQPVMARRESLIEVLARLARKHRAAALASGLALASIAVISLIALVEVNRQRGLAADSAKKERQQKLEAQTQRDRANQLADAEKAARDEAESLAERNQQVVDTFVAAFRSSDVTHQGVTSKMTALEVLQGALERLDDDATLTGDPLARATLLEAIGISFDSLGAIEEAVDCHHKSLQLRTEALGEDDPLSLESANNLAASYLADGQWEESLEINEQVLRIRRKTLGDTHLDTMASTNNLAATYYQLGRLPEAAAMFADALEAQRTKYGEKHKNAISTLNNLAYTYKMLGQLDKAIPMLERCLELRIETLGQTHPHSIISLNNLALAYEAADRVEEAIPLYELAVKLSTSKLGENHHDTLANLNNLAGGYTRIGRDDDALEIYRQVLSKRKETLGLEHSETLTTMNNLGNLLSEMGQQAEGLAMLEETLRLRQKHLGKKHHLTLSSVNNLAACYPIERVDEAIALLEPALILQSEVLGDSHPDTLAMKINLARSLTKAKRHSEAIATAKEALESARANLGPEHNITRAAVMVLADGYEQAGKPEPAAKLLKEYEMDMVPPANTDAPPSPN